MMAENRLTATSKLKRTIAWLILSSLWLVAACAPGEVYGPSPSGYNYPYSYSNDYLHGPHSDYDSTLP